MLRIKHFSRITEMILFVLSKRINMKRLSNISPFILLLIPVFLMALFTIIPVNQNNDDQNDATVKTSGTTSVTNVLSYLTK